MQSIPIISEADMAAMNEIFDSVGGATAEALKKQTQDRYDRINTPETNYIEVK